MIDIDKFIRKRVTRALIRYDMIQPHDKILIAVSGGKDSMTLLRELAEKQKHFHIPFTIEAVHVKTDIAEDGGYTDVEHLFNEWGVTLHTIPLLLKNRILPEKQVNCYWCSIQRKVEILKIAQARKCNKIALGHHLDDIIETFFINLVYKGKFDTMPPVFHYTKYPFSIIRPLCLLLKRHIDEYVAYHQLLISSCCCPFRENTKRKVARDALRLLVGEKEELRYTIYSTLNKTVFPKYRKKL
jgi:tRNA 2-thiocytidine biosynthesis protein TtcA